MSNNVFDILNKRGLIAQVSDEETVSKMLGENSIVFYIGFDSTANSLHAGSLVPIMAMMHLQKAGHKPIVIVGGGTTMVGDPSGKTELRKMLPEDAIREYGRSIHGQIDKYLHFDGKNCIALDNADWLLPLKYVEFLREVGRHFSVNRMLSAEAYKLRLEKGLSFIEFNYQLLQAYDYYHLFRNYGCTLQMGGDDQWGNILAGVDLIRRMEGEKVEAMTFPLLESSSGAKMGKTASGAVWLEADKFSPYEFYQYWINCDDSDVGRFLRTFTFLPLDEIGRMENLEGSEIREAKQILAFEATVITHGKENALKARKSSESAFGNKGDFEGIPTTNIDSIRLEEGISFMELIAEVGLTGSKKEAKRLIQQGGLYINNVRVNSNERIVNNNDLTSDGILLRAGKKKYHRIILNS